MKTRGDNKKTDFRFGISIGKYSNKIFLNVIELKYYLHFKQLFCWIGSLSCYLKKCRVKCCACAATTAK